MSQGLEIKEHAVLGIYVQGLQDIVVEEVAKAGLAHSLTQTRKRKRKLELLNSEANLWARAHMPARL